ncbi:MAG: porin family protein [Prevotellaceae bacterium]|jgi:opacity protein-like surface antigen|nr:porin family protein [Prevotellaceae bacterium]
MKKILIFLVMFIAVKSNAQFFAGVEAKAGISNIIATDGWDNGFSYFAGANAGYEFFKHIPVSVGIGYGELKVTHQQFNGLRQTGFIIPLKAGYCHYFGNFKPFANVGIFYSIKNKLPNIYTWNDELGALEESGVYFENYFGYLGQIGVGYKITDRLTASIAYEYNRPNKRITVNSKQVEFQSNGNGFYFSGATISASIYF